MCACSSIAQFLFHRTASKVKPWFVKKGAQFVCARDSPSLFDGEKLVTTGLIQLPTVMELTSSSMMRSLTLESASLSVQRWVLNF